MMLSKIQSSNRPAKGITLLHGDERRRTHRVIIRVPLTLEITENGKAARVAVHTIAVNVHGAMIVSSRTLQAGTEMQIVNERTHQKAGGRVTRTPRDSAEGFLVPIEFTSDSPNFWQISFPPDNWKVPEH